MVLAAASVAKATHAPHRGAVLSVVADLVAIDLRPGPEFLDTLRRAWDRGDAVLPLPQEAPGPLRLDIAQRMGAGIWVDRSGTHETDCGWPVEEGDALVVATSGTTGEPKGAVHTHESIAASAYLSSTALGVSGDTHWLCCLPLSHVAGLSVITRAWETGSELTLHDGFDPAQVDAVGAGGATHVSLVPTALRRIDPTRWRRILLGGSSIPHDRPANTVAGYGLTETYGGIVYEGQPLPGVGLRIAGIGPGAPELGPIEVRTPSAMRGYRRTGPVSTGAGQAHGFDQSGWFRTGDLGWIDPLDGRLRVEGRADDLIITGGEKVWPGPVERALEAHPSVAEAAVVGVVDREWGERVKAVVVPAEDSRPPELRELREWISQTLPRAAAPRELELAKTLPRTTLGKLRRSSLYPEGGDGDTGGGADGN